MANWQQQTDLLGGFKANFQDINKFVIELDKILTAIDQINALITGSLSTVSTLQGIALPDVTRVASETLKNAVLEYINNFKASGVYWLPVMPEPQFTFDAFDSIKGGYDAFVQRVINSTKDYFDQNRPVFDSTATVASLMIIVDSGDVSTILEFIDAINKLFDIQVQVNYNIAPIINLGATVGNGQILLNWASGKGITPTEFEIKYWLKSKTEADSTVITIGNTQEDKIVYPVEGLLQDTVYKFKVTPKFTLVYGEGQDIECKTDSSKGSANRDDSGSSQCGNLRSDFDGIYHCIRNSPNFRISGNTNGRMCFNGTILCDQYGVKKCKFYDFQNKKCISTGITTIKSVYTDELGSTIGVPNQQNFHPCLCLNGESGNVCDGYTAQENIEGIPPNWGQISIQQFLHPDVNKLLNYVESMVTQFFNKTSRSDDASKVFNDVFSETSDYYKNLILEIRDIVTSLNDLFSISTPDVYILEVPPSTGGTDYFVNQLQSAQNSPPSNLNNYTAGFVLFFGGNSFEVNLAYNSWKTLISGI